MKIVNMKITDIRPYEKNPRHNEGAVAAVAKSIKEFGWQQPIVVDKDMVVIVGHTRLKAAEQLGLTEVPVLVAEHLTPEQVQAYRIADNKTGEIAEWDYALLPMELKDLQNADFDLSVLGFDADELDQLLNGDAGDPVTEGETEPDAVPDVPKEPVSKRGEIYQLGKHRLLCGDATKAEDVARLMGEENANLWLTDPPYNVAYEGSNGMTIENDDMEDAQFRTFLRDAFQCVHDRMGPGASFYIFHADSEGYNFRGACHDIGLKVRQCLIWKKNALVLGRQDYQWIHELWEFMFPGARQELIQLVVGEIVVFPERISFVLKVDGLKDLASEMAVGGYFNQPHGNPAEIPESRREVLDDGSIRITMKLELKRIEGHRRVVIPAPGAERLKQTSLLRAINNARKWMDMLINGEAQNVTDLSKQLGLKTGYVSRILSLNSLAPDIVEAILAGIEPDGLSIAKLTEQPIPEDWNEQRRLYGFPER